jgi:hypothetical protein
MTLNTRVYIADRIDYREVFAKCDRLIGADEGVKFTDEPGSIWNNPGQGLCALLDVTHGNGSPLRAEPEPCDEYCEPDCDGIHQPACWLDVSFDTGYSYSGPEGGCGDLHARLVAELGRWLDGRGIRWSWQNEFTGEIHQGYEGLTELGAGGLAALGWFAASVAPAIRAMGGQVA